MVIALAAVVPVGWLAARVRRNPTLGRRLGAVVAIVILTTLIITIARGELLRFTPGGGGIDDCGQSLSC